MGVGHVPTGEIRQERQGDDVPRRQHRGAGADLRNLSRIGLGRCGERLAARFLQDRGARVLQRNARVGDGELDLIVAIGGRRVAVEVKTTSAMSSGDAVYHFNEEKQRQVRSLANRIGAHRVDYVGVELSTAAATVRWLPGVC